MSSAVLLPLPSPAREKKNDYPRNGSGGGAAGAAAAADSYSHVTAAAAAASTSQTRLQRVPRTLAHTPPQQPGPRTRLRCPWATEEDVALLTVVLQNGSLLSRHRSARVASSFWSHIADQLVVQWFILKNKRQCRDRFKLLLLRAMCRSHAPERGAARPTSHLEALLCTCLATFAVTEGREVVLLHGDDAASEDPPSALAAVAAVPPLPPLALVQPADLSPCEEHCHTQNAVLVETVNVLQARVDVLAAHVSDLMAILAERSRPTADRYPLHVYREST
ncbi:LAMI_0G16732g1_1 [Lachancea mirantina]|uniref:LAMI_0G16732g1_1 n=1 Tax=Lachancea mirantina TaxID=1230905 RepID=A0A1G4KCU7_9SACH|nr:LAMI_0G16732g1_1 [Lachancea mirantina]